MAELLNEVLPPLILRERTTVLLLLQTTRLPKPLSNSLPRLMRSHVMGKENSGDKNYRLISAIDIQ